MTLLCNYRTEAGTTEETTATTISTTTEGTTSTISATTEAAATSASAVQCELLTAPENGTVFTSDQEEVGSEALYQCDAGFFLQGDQSRVCTDAGEWTGAVPSCMAGMMAVLSCGSA